MKSQVGALAVKFPPLLCRSSAMLAGVLALALAASAAAADTPTTSADLVTPGDQYPMPKGLHSWATVLADVFVNKVTPHCVSFLLQKT